MTQPTVTVERCYRTKNGWAVTVKGRAMSFPIAEEVVEGTSVRIFANQAERA